MIFTGGAIADILVGHKAEITALGITSEGMRAISASLDNTMKMWDLRTGKVTKTINGVGKDVLQVRSCLCNFHDHSLRLVALVKCDYTNALSSCNLDCDHIETNKSSGHTQSPDSKVPPMVF